MKLPKSNVTIGLYVKGTFDIVFRVHVVLHPRGIAPNFLILDSWSLGAGFIPIISTKGINQIKKKKMKKKVKF